MIDEFFEPLGAQAYAHIRDLADGRGIGVRETEPVIIVSVVKLFIAWEFRRQVEEGRIDPAAPIRVTAADRLGGTGTAGFRYDSQIAVWDLAALMMEVSDSTAADLVVKHMGAAALRGLPARVGLKGTRLVGSPRTILEDVARDLDVSDLEALAHVLESGAVSTEELRRTSAWDPMRTNVSTPADLTAFLRHVWNGPEPVAADVRRWMGRQLTGGRLTRLAPSAVKSYGRSGSLPGWLSEVAVWEWPDGRRHAIAVFARPTRGNFREIELAMSRAALALTERFGAQ
ncbi:class A beta-lactamase-related serine hydrolase [Glycomyces sp. TRM65418]|uniref:serine hydrolase n=1 Tax=Glycomyces sp. TRM65418 TaxID=2867006 RepID=UPI001CE6C813|nr:serine hydrolase [Glycomyces sp. TRM65418]MCC3763053.1 class A beta-lactamase-related serine hydrolase [Glycomyces sp. TRM65418]QZD57067.1 class A beta-lactamase-related serine hydrolase [Glycomyces sp. TRM65418]